MCNSESLKGEEGGRNKKHEETIPRNIIIKLLKIKDKEKILKVVNGKDKSYTRNKTAYFLLETR